MRYPQSRRFRIATGVVLAVGLAVTTTACNRGSSANSSSGSGQAKIAIVTRDFTNPYWAALRDGAIAEGKKQNVTVNVQAGDNETDSSGENAKISTLAGQNYNCFGVVPVNATNVITPLVPVAQKGIPILNLDTQIDPAASKSAGVSYASFIGSDNLQAGTLAGQALQKKVGSGNVAILQGIAGEQNGINREKGFAAATTGKLTVVAKQPADYDQSKAQTVTEAILHAHPDIKGIFAANDTMGLGAAQAVKNAGKSGQITIISVDGIKAALQAVQSGTLSATITQYPYAEGQLAVQACIKAVAKKSVPARIVAPIKLIDKSNVDKAIGSFPQPFEPYQNPLAG
ncbi:substrate-binding domain-containing protein [Fodinicola acaciae]|uniref:sugar ABC transporter substrate-binding protein n=1 Tax=Fodinicola acaciae TaxID=2681555 RepID=UPI0013D39C87|nr:substrate-binding domain-containing protein [Fodinicola acaciae]